MPSLLLREVRVCVSSVAAGVLCGIQDGPLNVKGARFRIGAAEDEDQVLPAERLRHEVPAAAGLLAVGKGGFERRRRVELGLLGGGEEFDGLLKPEKAGGFFFDAADAVVEVGAGGFGEGVEESYEAVAAEGASEERVEA
jgi:hypothetical protein